MHKLTGLTNNFKGLLKAYVRLVSNLPDRRNSQSLNSSNSNLTKLRSCCKANARNIPQRESFNQNLTDKPSWKWMEDGMSLVLFIVSLVISLLGLLGTLSAIIFDNLSLKPEIHLSFRVADVSLLLFGL